MRYSIPLIMLPLGSIMVNAGKLFDRHTHLEHNRYISDLQAGPANEFNTISRRSHSSRCSTDPKVEDDKKPSLKKHPQALVATALAPSSTSQATPNLVGVVGTIEALVNGPSDCGSIGATKEVTAISGPNGNINWLNCGITGSGWTPPLIRVTDVIYANLTSAVQDPQSAFEACKSFIPYFEQYGNQYGVPAIFLASFAMQESSCNENAVGGGGEQGLMQLTKDKCTDAPSGNCKDPNYNIMTGAKYFADTLNGNGGNLLLTIGGYNGWPRGLTVGQATAAAKTSCCRCQNNLDYLHQFLNGWAQGVNAYSHQPPLGKYFNLNSCPSS